MSVNAIIMAPDEPSPDPEPDGCGGTAGERACSSNGGIKLDGDGLMSTAEKMGKRQSVRRKPTRAGSGPYTRFHNNELWRGIGARHVTALHGRGHRGLVTASASVPSVTKGSSRHLYFIGN
ncbi:unnamed protein product [Ixodes pacificus]